MVTDSFIDGEPGENRRPVASRTMLYLVHLAMSRIRIRNFRGVRH